MRFYVRVQPGASRERLVKNADNSLKVYLTKRAVEGEANKALIKLLARHFDVAASRVKIARGGKSRVKLIEIE